MKKSASTSPATAETVLSGDAPAGESASSSDTGAAQAAVDATRETLEGAPGAPGSTETAERPRARARAKRRRRGGLNAKELKEELRQADARVDELEGQLEQLEATPEERIADASASLRMAFRGAGLILAKFFGRHWEFSLEEERNLGDAWAPPLAPWLAKADAARPWIGAIVVSAAIIGPRIELTRLQQVPTPAEPGTGDDARQPAAGGPTGGS